MVVQLCFGAFNLLILGDGGGGDFVVQLFDLDLLRSFTGRHLLIVRLRHFFTLLGTELPLRGALNLQGDIFLLGSKCLRDLKVNDFFLVDIRDFFFVGKLTFLLSFFLNGILILGSFLHSLYCTSVSITFGWFLAHLSVSMFLPHLSVSIGLSGFSTHLSVSHSSSSSHSLNMSCNLSLLTTTRTGFLCL